MRFVIGLDLGQTSDFTALSVLKREPAAPGDDGRPERDHRGRPLNRYACVAMKRYPLGLPYPRIVEDLGTLVGTGSLGRPALVVDATGVGRAVVDMFVDARLPVAFHALTITGGQEVRSEPRSGGTDWHVPKVELVSCAQRLLQCELLKIVPTLPLAETLRRELLDFKVKVTLAANEQFGAWREGSHDDLVLAVAMAAFLGENAPGPAGMPGFGGARAPNQLPPYGGLYPATGLPSRPARPGVRPEPSPRPGMPNVGRLPGAGGAPGWPGYPAPWGWPGR